MPPVLLHNFSCCLNGSAGVFVLSFALTTSLAASVYPLLINLCTLTGDLRCFFPVLTDWNLPAGSGDSDVVYQQAGLEPTPAVLAWAHGGSQQELRPVWATGPGQLCLSRCVATALRSLNSPQLSGRIAGKAVDGTGAS
jgi:hypothetical protein